MEMSSKRSEVSFRTRRDAGYESAGLPISVDRRRGKMLDIGAGTSPAAVQRELDEVCRRIRELSAQRSPEVRRHLAAEFDKFASANRMDEGQASGDRNVQSGQRRDLLDDGGRFSTSRRPYDDFALPEDGRAVPRWNGDPTPGPSRRLSSDQQRQQSDENAENDESAAVRIDRSRVAGGGSRSNATSHSNTTRRTSATIKLGSYDGSSALETHLAKLKNCSDYYRWDARERLCHLKASLDGSAGQVLWQIGENATENDVIQLLKNRFGSLNQAERYRAELKSRRRRPGESIQSVYHDIRRLLALSFPGHSGELCEIIGRDAFLEALVDQTLRIRVLDQQPATLDEALAIVCRMDAYGGTVSTDVDDLGRRKVRTINVDPPAVERNESSVSDRRLHILEEALAEQKR